MFVPPEDSSDSVLLRTVPYNRTVSITVGTDPVHSLEGEGDSPYNRTDRVRNPSTFSSDSS